jgi:methyl-accepting chemotaxis protein
LKDASTELAKRTESQAAALEETSAALIEITTNVRESSKRAEEASSNISSARQNSENSDKVVSSTINAMKQIEKTSGEIASIISVIDDIAFQTNLLALNAGEIVKDVSNIDGHMQNIAQASSEQSAGLNQISTAVTEMDHATQQNSEMVQRTNDITKRVAGGSHLLHDLMADFKTRDINGQRRANNRGSHIQQDIEELADAELPVQKVAI